MTEQTTALQNAIGAHDREIRRLRSRLDYLTTGDGLRSIRIVGIIPDENLPALAAFVTYLSFGSEPVSGQVAGTAQIYAADMLIQVTA